MDSKEFYLDIINHLCEGVYFVDTKRKIQFWNQAAEKITGYSAADIVGKNCQTSGLNHIDAHGCPLCHLNCPLYATLADGQQRQDKVLLRHKEGYRIPVSVTIFPVCRQKEIVGAVEIFTQDSPSVFADGLVDRLSNIAMHDQLTHLPNRRYLESVLDYRMEEYHRFGESFCVLFADIDDFSRINNTYGHEAGDTVLKNIATSLSHSICRNVTIGRWGGEEFLGVYPISKPSECQIIAERFRSLVEHTEAVCGSSIIRSTVSVGISAVQPQDTVQTLVDRADQLMYASKRRGKNRVTQDSPS